MKKREVVMTNLWSAMVEVLAKAKGFVADQQQGLQDMAQLRIRLFCLRTIQTVRLLFVYLLGTGICLVFLLSSISMCNTTLFNYASLTPQAKMWLGFSLAAVYLIVACVVFSILFSEKKWLRIFHAHHMFRDLEDMSFKEKK